MRQAARGDIMKVKCRVHSLSIAVLSCFFIACSNPQPGPDKTVTGAVLGAGWGAGAGAVVGNQFGRAGEGTGIGAGFGMVSGALHGAGLDLNEGALLDQERSIDEMRVRNMANAAELRAIQAKIDRDGLGSQASALGVHSVHFDRDETSLKIGSTANLEALASMIMQSPGARKVHVIGHADDSGSPAYNERLAEARARSVGSFLAAKGISSDQIMIKSYGSKHPVASNSSETGRQLNRRVDIYVTR